MPVAATTTVAVCGAEISMRMRQDGIRMHSIWMQRMSSTDSNWNSDCDGMRRYVDSFLERNYRLYFESDVIFKDDSLVLRYDLPNYLFKNKGYCHFLEFIFTYTHQKGNDITGKFIRKGSKGIEETIILGSIQEVDSFLSRNIGDNLAVSTPQNPVVEELFRLNKKFDRLLKSLEDNSKRHDQAWETLEGGGGQI